MTSVEHELRGQQIVPTCVSRMSKRTPLSGGIRSYTNTEGRLMLGGDRYSTPMTLIVLLSAGSLQNNSVYRKVAFACSRMIASALAPWP